MFQDKLKEYRNKYNLTQKELAEKIYVSRSAVAKWEQGRGLPTVESLKALCDFFDISEDELMDKKEPLIMYNKIKIKKDFSYILTYLFLGFTGFIVFIVVVNFILDNIPNKKYSTIKGEYETLEIGLPVNEKYYLDINNMLINPLFIYDNYEIIDTEEYDVNKNYIIPKKSGIFYVDVRFYNRKERTFYTGTALKIYVYNKEEMIKINTAEDLCNINNNKNGHYILNSNIDLSGIENFNPIGNHPAGNEFSGFFINPNNYIIKNLTIKSGEYLYQMNGCSTGALFGSVKDSYLDNIILENVNIDVSDFAGESKYDYSDAGGLTGLITNSLVTNCRVTGNIKGQLYVGGLFACANHCTIKNNCFNGTVTQVDCDNWDACAGGLTGWLYSVHNNNVSRRIENNMINAYIKADNIASKIAGVIEADYVKNNLVNCVVEGKEEYEIGKPRWN